MRPRITTDESKLILGLLKAKANTYVNRHQDFLTLERTVLNLRRNLRTDPYQVILVDRLKDKEKLLDQMKFNSGWKEERLTNRLIKKYSKLLKVLDPK